MRAYIYYYFMVHLLRLFVHILLDPAKFTYQSSIKKRSQVLRKRLCGRALQQQLMVKIR